MVCSVWSESLSAADRSSFGDMLVLQGDDDNVVDADQGTTLLKNTFTNAQIQWVRDGRHALLNEGIYDNRDILPEVYDSIVKFINQ